MSKLQSDVVAEAIGSLLEKSKEKKRKFLETIELQIALKNYDPQKDKRFSGAIRLPYQPRVNFSVCLMGNQKDIDSAKAVGLPSMSVDDLKKLNKNKKLVKKLAAKYDAFLASAVLIRKIPRLLGPGLNKAGKFPTSFGANDDLADKAADAKCSIKFQLKSKKTTCMGVPVANVGMSAADIGSNITLAVNFCVSLLPKQWQQVKRLYIKSTMGPSHRIYGF
jgi:large subunit ribosomal protein L10Ae